MVILRKLTDDFKSSQLSLKSSQLLQKSLQLLQKSSQLISFIHPMSEERRYSATSPQEEISRIKQRLIELEEEEEEDQCENDYEELLKVNPRLVHASFSDSMSTKHLDIRCTPVSQIKGILKYFKGATQSIKKEALIRFLQAFPCFKTRDISLLKRRLKRFRKTARALAAVDQLNGEFWESVQNHGFLVD